ncbi:uncharacterized protein LOC135214812 [Macrobrachium nipponense]|uniref:uncharacterized protein LOC135214812 n=1 Tax=Macrobrachium nipponense TaxID=159736 RepID=UPI0030C84108
MEQGEKGGSMKYQNYTLEDFLLSSHVEQMEFMMLSPGMLQTAYDKERWSNQFLKFLKTIVHLGRIVFLQTLQECNESSQWREEKEVEEKGEAEEEEGMEKKGDTPEKEKGSSSEGSYKKKSGNLSPQQINAKVLNVLCSVLEEWETAKVLCHYGKQVIDASFAYSPLGMLKDKGSTKEKVPKSKIMLLKETPEKRNTDKKVTLKLQELKKEPKEQTPYSNQLQRSWSLTSADTGLRSIGKVVKDEGGAKEKVPNDEGKSLEKTPEKAYKNVTLKLKEEATACNRKLQRSQSLKLEDIIHSRVETNKAEKIVPKAEVKPMEATPKKADEKGAQTLKVETTYNKQLQTSQQLKLEDRSLSRTEVKEAEVSDVKIKKHSEDVKVSTKTETLLKSQEGLAELSNLRMDVRDMKIALEKKREEKAQTSLKQCQEKTQTSFKQPPTPALFSSSPPQPVFYSPPEVYSSPSPPQPAFYSPPEVYSSPSPPQPAFYSPPEVYSSPPQPVFYSPPKVYSSPSPPPVVFSPPAPKVPVATPKPSAPSGYVHVREHYRQGHEVKGHWRGDTWVEPYYRQGHTVSGHYRRK